jgi:hypothetical protein
MIEIGTAISTCSVHPLDDNSESLFAERIVSLAQEVFREKNLKNDGACVYLSRILINFAQFKMKDFFSLFGQVFSTHS